MANNAHFKTAHAGQSPQLIIRDDRGAPILERELPTSVTEPSQADQELEAAGWTRNASSEWTEADDGWVVPVVPS